MQAGNETSIPLSSLEIVQREDGTFRSCSARWIAYSGSTIATPEAATAKWLFHQEKATLHIGGNNTRIVEPLYTSFASSVISVLFAKSFEIGQPALAPAAALSNASFLAPGTLAVVVSAILVIAKPASTLASVTAA